MSQLWRPESSGDWLLVCMTQGRLSRPQRLAGSAQLIGHADRTRAPGPLTPPLLPAANRQAGASYAADYAQGCGLDPATGVAAFGEDRPEPTSATGRAGARPAR